MQLEEQTGRMRRIGRELGEGWRPDFDDVEFLFARCNKLGSLLQECRETIQYTLIEDDEIPTPEKANGYGISGFIKDKLTETIARLNEMVGENPFPPKAGGFR